MRTQVEGYARVIIETSPFLRCMETAAAIAKELNVEEITVNYKWGEIMKYGIFPYGSPIAKLIVNTTSEEELSTEWLQGV